MNSSTRLICLRFASPDNLVTTAVRNHDTDLGVRVSHYDFVDRALDPDLVGGIVVNGKAVMRLHSRDDANAARCNQGCQRSVHMRAPLLNTIPSRDREQE